MFEINHIHFDSIGSTNTWAKAHVAKWATPRLTLVTATQQTGGRGRFKRQWVSPPDVNIYATFCFLVSENRSDIGHIPQLLALAACQLLEQLGFSPKIKWPNDILIGNRKIAGVLCESVLYEGMRGVVLGIGLNVNMPKAELQKIDRPATSMQVEGGKFFVVQEILDELQKKFNAFLSEFILTGFSAFWEAFQSRSYFKKGDFVRFHDNQRIIQGSFEALLPDGSMAINLDGEVKVFHAGEFV